MNSNGRTVVVIGAGSGTGRAVAVDSANAGLFARTNPFLTGSVLPIDGGALLMSSDLREGIHAQTEYRTTSRIPPKRLLSSS